MKRLLLTTIFVCLSSLMSHAQNMQPLDVNGLIVGKQYTDTQVRAALGQPTKYNVWNDELGGGREYRYTIANALNVFMYQSEFGGFCEFVISSPNFKLFNGQLKVGDNISKISLLERGTPISKGDGIFYLYLGDDPLVLTVNSSNKITAMSYTISI